MPMATAQHTPTPTQSGAPTAAKLATALLPSAAFLAADHVAGLTAGIAAASVTSAALVITRRRSGRRLGVVLPVSLAYVVLRAVAGVITDSPQLFFGLSLGLSALTALAVAATALTARPAAVHMIPAVVGYADRTVAHPLYRRVAAQLTVAWAAAELAVTGWEATHLAHATASQFVVTRTFVGWPLMAAWICALIFYLRFRLDPLDHHLARGASA